jgi:hypothetical protein
MAKKSGSTLEGDALKIFRGGKGLPEKAVRQYLSDLRNKEKKQIEKVTAIKQQMTKYLTELQKAGEPQPGRGNTKALEGLLSAHKKLASQKLVAPKIPIGLGGVYGGFSVQVVPPYDYDQVISEPYDAPGATISGSANRLTGQLAVSAVSSSEPGYNGGGYYATVGIYFHPVTAGTLTASINPTYSFEWWTNSLASFETVQSFGEGALTIYGIDVAGETTSGLSGIETTGQTQFVHWSDTTPDAIGFGAGFDLQTPTSLTVDVVPTQVYLIFVDVNVDILAAGWPGSLAGGMLSATVPYINYEFQVRQVLEP